MQCPYCGGNIKERIEYLYLSVKRRGIVHYILEAGPDGLPLLDLKEKFFQGRKDTTVRTTIYAINKAIAPSKIAVYGKIVRVIAPERLAPRKV